MDTNASCDQLIVRVWKACNFWCNFCNVTDNERNVKMKENIEDIVRNFHYKLKYSNYESGQLTVTISGWEPSLFKKETVFALKYIRQVLEKKWVEPIFEIQTNASRIDIQFARIIAALWVRIALVSFHMTDKDIFDKVIQVPYESNYHKIIEGIQHLHDAGITVYTNTILTQETKDNFYDTIVFLAKTFPFIPIFNIGIVQPHGEAKKILNQVYPRYDEVAWVYNRALFYLKSRKKEVVSHFVWLPACYMSSFASSLEVSQNTLFRKNFNFTNHYLINKINDDNKKQVDECNSCLYNNVCSGIWDEYIGLQKLKPLPYVKDYFENFHSNTFAFKIDSIGVNLKKLYDKNIRQIIIPTSLGNKSDIIALLQKCTKIGFYKISLLVDNNFPLEEDIFYTGVGNIQICNQKLDLGFLTKLIEFCKRNSPQFRIDIDIFFTTKREVSDLIPLIKLLPNPFLKVYLRHDFNEKSYNLSLYKRLLNKLNLSESIVPINFSVSSKSSKVL